MYHYFYGMRLRGCAIGCQPKKGFVDRMDDLSGNYWDIIVYNRELTEDELREYELNFLMKECAGVLNEETN